MCEPTTIMLLSAAASAGGTYLQYDAASEAADQQKRILANAEEENQRLNKAGEEAIDQFAEKTFGAQDRGQRYEAAAKGREQSLAEALASAQPGDAQAASGNVSSDYLATAAQSRADSMGDAQKRARLMARAGAGGLLYGQESLMGGQLASDLAGLGVKARRNDRYARNAAGAVNGGSLAGGLLTGAGAAGMGYAGSMGSTGTTTNPPKLMSA